MKRTTINLLLLVSLVAVVVVAELPRLEHPVKADGSVSILVIGDWGRRGLYNQSNVAHQMGKVGEEMDVDFIVSTGDNFYDNGLIDEDDPAFFESFTNIYTAPSLQKQWYSVLGNHDYRGNVLAQLSPTLKQRDHKWLCRRSLILQAGNVEFFFFDTSPFQDEYFTDTVNVYDWRGVVPQQKYISDLLQDVDVALKESKARWKIVVAHHPIFSASKHGTTQSLVDKLLPILEANEVDIYMNGHDHCLQHISSPNSQIQFFTSGGGSKAWNGVINPWNPDEMKFYYDGQGFMAVEIIENEVNVVMYDAFGQILHKWSTFKNDREEHSAI